MRPATLLRTAPGSSHGVVLYNSANVHHRKHSTLDLVLSQSVESTSYRACLCDCPVMLLAHSVKAYSQKAGNNSICGRCNSAQYHGVTRACSWEISRMHGQLGLARAV